MNSRLLARVLTACPVILIVCGCATPQAPRRASQQLLDRTRSSAAVQLAADNIANGKFDRARGALAALPARGDLEVELARARIDVEEGAYATALSRLDGVEERGQDSAAWQSLRGVALEGLGRWADAAAAYERVYALSPDADGLVAWADALACADRLDEARGLLSRERGRYPGEAALCLLAARLAARAGDAGAAADELAAAVLAKPDRTDLRRRLGDALMRAGRGAEAIAVWESLSVATLDDVARLRVQARLAECLLGAGRHAEAQRAYRVVLGATPDDVPTRLGLATALLAGGAPQEALQAASAILAKHPEHADALLVAALALRQLDQTAAGIALLMRAEGQTAARPLVRELLAAWRAAG